MSSRALQWVETTVFSLVASVSLCNRSLGQEQEAAHNELRNMRDEMMAAFQSRDIDALVSYLHPKIVATWQNAEVSRGHEGVRNYYQKMMVDESSPVKSVTADLAVDELSLLYGGDTAIAFGTLDESFVLRNGLSFDLANRWTATVVRENDRWLLAAFHVSTNMFENGLQDRLLKWNSLKSGAIALAAGIILSLVGSKLWARRKGTGQIEATAPR